MALGFAFAYHVAEEFLAVKSKAVRYKRAYLGQICFTCLLRNKREQKRI